MRLSEWERIGLDVHEALECRQYLPDEEGVLHAAEDRRYLSCTTKAKQVGKGCTAPQLDTELCEECWTIPLNGTELEEAIHSLTLVERGHILAQRDGLTTYGTVWLLIALDHLAELANQNIATQKRREYLEEFTATRTEAPSGSAVLWCRNSILTTVLGVGTEELTRKVAGCWREDLPVSHLLQGEPDELLEIRQRCFEELTFLGADRLQYAELEESDTRETLETALSLYERGTNLDHLEACLAAARAL